MNNQYKVVTPQLKYFEEGCTIIQAGAISGEMFYLKKGGDDLRHLPHSLIESMPDWFEKVKERIKLDPGCKTYLMMNANKDPFSNDQFKLCEKVLNGEMVEKVLIIEWIERYLHKEAYIERLAKIVGYKLPNQQVEKVSKEAREIVTLTDTGTFRRDEYKKEREAEDEGDTYILKDSQSTFIRKTFTEHQVVELGYKWIDECYVGATPIVIQKEKFLFKEFLNKTL